jgi:ubiquinone/menaquinone biosynthesis C-methylase UbiE
MLLFSVLMQQSHPMQLDEYRKLAAVEDEMWYFRALNRRMLLPLEPWRNRTAHVLDAGCGTGGLIKDLQAASPHWQITGLDYSPTACSLAHERTAAKIVQGSITALPFPNESFDIVVSADVISQVEDGSQAIREFARVLKPEGMVVINVAAYQWMWSYHDITCETKHRFRRSELLRLLERAGLTPVMSSYANMLIFPLIFSRRKLFPPANRTSDVNSYSPAVEGFCGAMAGLEYASMRRGLSLPAGTSIFVAATKP